MQNSAPESSSNSSIQSLLAPLPPLPNPRYFMYKPAWYSECIRYTVRIVPSSQYVTIPGQNPSTPLQTLSTSRVAESAHNCQNRKVILLQRQLVLLRIVHRPRHPNRYAHDRQDPNRGSNPKRRKCHQVVAFPIQPQLPQPNRRVRKNIHEIRDATPPVGVAAELELPSPAIRELDEIYRIAGDSYGQNYRLNDLKKRT